MNDELRRSPFFRGLTGPELDGIVGRARVMRVKRGEVLFRQDETARYTYVVASGRLKMQQVSADGSQTLLRVLEPGQILAIVSIEEAGVYPATAVAERDSVLLGWDGKALDGLFLEYPRFCRNTLMILSKRVREMQERFSELAAERTERRLARALIRLAAQVGRKESEGIALDLSLSRQDLAEMIGTTLFSVSRILSEWGAQGWVKLGRQKVLILEPHSIMKIAEEEA